MSPFSSTPDLVVDSATGVDVSLPIAGPGARALAFVLDWHIRVILMLTWYVIAAALYNGRWSIGAPLEPNAAWFVGVVAPPAAIFLLYHFVLEVAMRGRTPGKRMAGIRIVTREGNTPSIGALLTRNVFRLIDSFPLLYSVGLISTMLTRDHVRIGDLAAGTVLVYDRTGARPPPRVRGGALDATAAEVVGELLQRWNALEPHARQRLARKVLARYGSPTAGESDVAGDTAHHDEALRRRLEHL